MLQMLAQLPSSRILDPRAAPGTVRRASPRGGSPGDRRRCHGIFRCQGTGLTVSSWPTWRGGIPAESVSAVRRRRRRGRHRAPDSLDTAAEGHPGEVLRPGGQLHLGPELRALVPAKGPGRHGFFGYDRRGICSISPTCASSPARPCAPHRPFSRFRHDPGSRHDGLPLGAIGGPTRRSDVRDPAPRREAFVRVRPTLFGYQSWSFASRRTRRMRSTRVPRRADRADPADPADQRRSAGLTGASVRARVPTPRVVVSSRESQRPARPCWQPSLPAATGQVMPGHG